MIKKHLVVTAAMATLLPLTVTACGGDSSDEGGGQSATVDALNVLDYYNDDPGKTQVGDMLQKCGTSIGVATVVFHVQPLWVLLFGAWWLREPVSRRPRRPTSAISTRSTCAERPPRACGPCCSIPATSGDAATARVPRTCSRRCAWRSAGRDARPSTSGAVEAPSMI